jgi:hypothetical protein
MNPSHCTRNCSGNRTTESTPPGLEPARVRESPVLLELRELPEQQELAPLLPTLDSSRNYRIRTAMAAEEGSLGRGFQQRPRRQAHRWQWR